MLTTPAIAQTGDSPFPADRGILFRNDVAGTRVQPDAAAAGIVVGTVSAYPAVTLTDGYDGNVFNTPRGRDDFYIALEPDLRLTRNDGANAVTLKAHGRFTRFAALSRQDSDEYRLVATATREIDVAAPLFAEASYARTAEPRGAFGLSLPDSRPSFSRQVHLAGGVGAELGPLRLRVAATTDLLRYEDIAIGERRRIDQSSRDLAVFQVSPRIEYGFGPDLGVFVSMTAAARRSLDAPASRRRNAEGGLMLAGVQATFGELVVGEVAAGWRSQQFDIARFQDYSGLTYYAKVDFYPTPLISLRVEADQDYENSGIAAVAGILADHFGTTAYWEALRTLLVTASLDLLRENYRGVDTRTTTTVAGLAADYSVHRNLTIGAKASYRRRTSTAPAIVPEYSGVRMMVSVTGKY